MYSVQYDKNQVAATCAAIMALTNQQETDATQDSMHQLFHDVVHFIEDAVKEYGNMSEPCEVHAGLITAVIWPLPKEEVKNYGHTHEVSLYINPTPSFEQQTGRTPAFEVSEIKLPDNDPRRLRYLHIRNYMQHFFNGVMLCEDLELKGGFTVCLQDNLDGTLTYAIAKCRSDEQYVRKTGRETAAALLLTDRAKTVTMTINEFRPWVESQVRMGMWK